MNNKKSGFMLDENKLVQMAVRRKVYQQVPQTLNTSTVTLRIQGTVRAGELNLSGAFGIIIRPSADIVAYYDSDTTKTWTITANETHEIILDPAIASVTLSGSATVEIGGF